MKLGLTYNVKKETVSAGELKHSKAGEYLNNDLMTKYPERIDDTFAEWDSMETIDAVREALTLGGHSVELIEADCEAYEKIRAVKPDIVFNVAEGFFGPSRESQIPAILEMLDVPFTGSDSITTGICHDKSRCKEILSYYNIPNAKFFISGDEVNEHSGSFPKFVKPLHEGSSKGIYNSSVVNNLSELNSEILRIKESYNQLSLIEDFIPGKEFTAAMLGNGDNVQMLPLVEINLDRIPDGFNKIYSYEVKWFFDTRENQLDIFRCPPDISTELYENIRNICIKTFKVLRLRDWARIDIRLDENNLPNIIEINPLPGILPDPADNSCFPKAGRAAGMDYNKLIQTILRTASERYNLR